MQILLMDLSHRWGNSQAHILALARALLDEQRSDVQICCPRNSPLARKARALRLPLCGLWGDSSANPLTLLHLWLLTRRHRYCLVHTFSAAAARLGWRVMHMRQTQRTVWLHNWQNSQSPPPDDSNSKLPPFWLEAHSLICANQHMLKKLLKAGLDPSQLVRLPAGVDTSPLTLPEQEQTADPVPELLRAQRLVIGSMTAHGDTAAHSLLLKAMAALWQSEIMPPWEVRILGDCPNFQALLDEAIALGVQSRLALLGAQPLHDVLPLCSLLVAPSTNPNGALPAIAAAWALHLPLLCPALPTNQEWANHEHNALLYTAEDPQHLAISIKRLIREPHLYQSLVNGAAHTAPSTSIEMAVRHCLDLYASQMTKRGWVYPPKPAPQEKAPNDAPVEAPATSTDSTSGTASVPDAETPATLGQS